MAPLRTPGLSSLRPLFGEPPQPAAWPQTPMTSEPNPLLARLRQRKLVQWALAYLAGAWLLLQLLDLLAQPFAWPDLVLRAATVVLAVGFFAALVLAWYHGERGGQRVTTIELAMLTGILIVAGVGVALVNPGEAGEASPSQAADSVPASPTNSVAVLPFENLSADPEQEYFSSGITEEILNALARIPGLRVPSRTSSFQFQGQRVDAREVGRRLGVAHVLEGSVRKGNDRVRITVQLIGADDGFHLWSETYDRELTDVLAVQEEIARAVARALEVRLADDGSEPLVRSGTTDVAAYELYLKGRYEWSRGTQEHYRRAIALFELAVERDSSYAAPWVGMADAYADLGGFEDRRENVARGRAALARALEMDPTLATAIDTEAYLLHTYDRDYAAAERGFVRSLQLDPENPVALVDYSRFLSNMGRHEEAIRVGRSGVSEDPLTPNITRNLGLVLLSAGHTEEALRTLRAAVELDPALGNIRASLADALLATGALDEALVEHRAARETGSVRSGAAMARSLALRGDSAEAGRHLEEVLAREDAALYAPDLAAALYALGRDDEAFRWLDVALEERDLSAAGFRFDVRLAAMRAEPRFTSVLRKAGLGPLPEPVRR